MKKESTAKLLFISDTRPGRRRKRGTSPEDSLTEDGSPRHLRRGRRFNSQDVKVDIPEFEGRLDPDDFLEWMQTVERIFEYKDIPDDQKVTIVAVSYTHLTLPTNREV